METAAETKQIASMWKCVDSRPVLAANIGQITHHAIDKPQHIQMCLPSIHVTLPYYRIVPNKRAGRVDIKRTLRPVGFQ